jgi:hypothetical protein
VLLADAGRLRLYPLAWGQRQLPAAAAAAVAAVQFAPNQALHAAGACRCQPSPGAPSAAAMEPYTAHSTTRPHQHLAWQPVSDLRAAQPHPHTPPRPHPEARIHGAAKAPHKALAGRNCAVYGKSTVAIPHTASALALAGRYTSERRGAWPRYTASVPHHPMNELPTPQSWLLPAQQGACHSPRWASPAACASWLWRSAGWAVQAQTGALKGLPHHPTGWSAARAHTAAALRCATQTHSRTRARGWQAQEVCALAPA